MKIIIGSDHGGFELKEDIKAYLSQNGTLVIDVGTYGVQSVDYPDIAKEVTTKVLEEDALGIVICGTGIGICIAANKVKGIRCALCVNEYMASMARRHNNANILALGGRVLGKDLAINIVDAFLREKFEGGRHACRVDKIGEMNG